MADETDDPFARTFELTARLREQSRDSVETAEESTEWARAQLRALVEIPQLSNEQRAQFEQLAMELTKTINARLGGLAKQVQGYVAMLAKINLQRPEDIGVMLSQAASLGSAAAMTAALAADIKLVQEIRRRLALKES